MCERERERERACVKLVTYSILIIFLGILEQGPPSQHIYYLVVGSGFKCTTNILTLVNSHIAVSRQYRESTNILTLVNSHIAVSRQYREYV